jgi:hypothetical protein
VSDPVAAEQHPHAPRRRTHRPSEAELRARVIEAWLSLYPEAAQPDEIEILIRKNKSAVCRLHRPTGPVIAKRARRQTALIEQRVHSRALPRLPFRTLEWHGIVEPDEDPSHCWLFMEDAGDCRVVPRSSADQPLIAAWLARLHATSVGSDGLVDLPDRGPADALARLQGARRSIQQSFEHPDPPESRASLDPVLRSLDTLEAHWQELEARCERTPRTLVHGDFVKKNMRVRASRGARELLVFDWEYSGVGFPGQDLAVVEPACYATAAREYRSDVDDRSLQRLFETGRVLRLLAEIGWASKGLGLRGSEYGVAALQLYGRRLEASLGTNGWEATRP